MSKELAKGAGRADSPEEVHILFETYVNEGRLDDLAALYEEEAVLIEHDSFVIGADAIMSYLAGLISSKPRISIRYLNTVTAGDVAAVVSQWKLSAERPDGSRMEDGGRSYDVVRRQTDGSWKVVIDSPWAKVPEDSPDA